MSIISIHCLVAEEVAQRGWARDASGYLGRMSECAHRLDDPAEAWELVASVNSLRYSPPALPLFTVGTGKRSSANLETARWVTARTDHVSTRCRYTST